VDTVVHMGPLPKGMLPGLPTDPPPTLICIVDLMNRTRQGTSKTGAPLYLAHPLDPAFPPILVGSRESDLTRNRFAMVKVNGFEDAYRWVRGELRSWIGAVGDPVAERMALIAASGSSAHPPLATLPALAATPLLDWDTCNIDPAGCTDIDDVISWRLEAGRVAEVAISIADVSAFLRPGTVEDVAAARRGQSLYSAGRVICPMIHPVVSEGAASLLADGMPRPVLSLVLPSMTWRRQFLINRRSYSYEEAATVAPLREVFRMCGAVTDDPHEWIERAMVLYNVQAAARLAGCGILRTQAPPDAARSAAWSAAATAAGMPALALLGYMAGVYATEGAHWALGEAAYCHATSPLRRYADVVNQRCLVALLEGATPVPAVPASLIDSLNERGRIAKQLDRSLLSIPLESIVAGEGIVIDISELKVGVYFLPWKTRITIRLLTPYGGAEGDRRRIKGFCDSSATNLKRRMIWSFDGYHELP